MSDRDNKSDDKTKPNRPSLPIIKRLEEFDATLENIQNSFSEMWPLIEHLDIEGFAPIQYHMGAQQADIIAIYLCGLVRGLVTDSEKYYSPLAAWEVAKGHVPYAIKEA